MRFMVILGVVLIATCSYAGDFTPTGAGGGGGLHSGAFLPTDGSVVVVGGDVSGVYRTDDFGDSWSPWNEGLTNSDECRTQHVEDLLGVDYDGWTGFYAATRGGIYRREEAGTWECMTPEAGYSYSGGGLGHEDIIPLSCLDWRSGSSLIVAGAGWVWFPTNEETSFYPRADSNEFSVWTLDLDDTSPAWEADSESAFGPARDISYAVINDSTFLAVGTSTGIFLKDADGWTSVGDSLYDSNLTCWSAHVSKRGTLYVAMGQLDGATLPSGVYRLHDVRSTTTWKWVGNPSIDSLDSIGEHAELVYLSVVDSSGTNPDLLYLGCRGGDVSNGDQSLYIGSQKYVKRNTCTWEQRILYDHAGFWILDYLGDPWPLDTGWMDWDGAINFHPVVSQFHPTRAMLSISAKLHRTENSGVWWTQCFTTEQSSGLWLSNGYNELCVMDLAFMSDGRTIESTGDIGLFRSGDSSLAEWEWLHAETYPPATPTDDRAWGFETGNAEVRPDWMGSGQDALFIVSGDLGQGMGPCKLFMIDSLDTWHNITASLNSDRYKFWDIGFSDDGTCFMPYTHYTGRVGSDTAAVDEFGVLRGVLSNGDWSWEPWNSGLIAVTSPDTMNTPALQVLYHESSGRIFLAARGYALRFPGQQSATEVPGGLYMLESSADSTWELECGGPGADWRDFRCLATSDSGEVVYAGTRGRSYYGPKGGTVFKCSNPGDSSTSWTVLANDTTFPFGFSVPFWHTDWTYGFANRIFTYVEALAVDPADPDVVYAGLYTEAFQAEAGLWVCDHGSWDHLSDGELFEGVPVTALAFSPHVPGQLIVGTHGQELYYDTVSSLLGSKRSNDSGFKATPAPGLKLVAIMPRQSDRQTSVRFSLDRATAIQADIFDVQGRVVHHREASVYPPGQSDLTWDGRNRSGERCAPGVYFLRLRAENETARGKIAIVD